MQNIRLIIFQTFLLPDQNPFCRSTIGTRGQKAGFCLHLLYSSREEERKDKALISGANDHRPSLPFQGNSIERYIRSELIVRDDCVNPVLSKHKDTGRDRKENHWGISRAKSRNPTLS